MCRRFGVVFIAAMFVLGLFTGLGSLDATALAAPAPCHGQAVGDMAVQPGAPAHDCQGTPMHTTCIVHAACVVFALPLPAVMQINMRAGGWHAAVPAGLHGTRLAPDTPPPIVLL